MRYSVDGCGDDPALLRQVLDQIAAARGRVISVIWEPERVIDLDGARFPRNSGYTIVSEHHD